MSLRLRVAIFTSLIFGLLATSLFFVFNNTLMDGFLQLEREGVLRNVARVQEGITTFADEMALKAEEWGTWDDSYEFIQRPNAEYESSNLSFEALSQLLIQHFLIMDTEGKSIRALQVDADKEVVIPIPTEAQELLQRVGREAIQREQRLSGLLRIGDSTLVVGAAPVTNSAGDAPLRGAIIFSREFNSDSLARLEKLAKVRVQLSDVQNFRTDQMFGPSLLGAQRENASVTLATENSIHGVDIVRDLFDTPIHGLVTSQARDLLARGLAARNMVTLYVSLFTLVALVISLVGINRIVIRPLRGIGAQTKEIGEQQNDQLRVAVKGDSEITQLTTEINKMLDHLALSKKDAVDAKLLAERANAAKSMFIARVSHELRTPVSGIIGINRIIKKDTSLPRSVKELIEMGDLTANGLLSIIDEILDFSKAEAGELQVEDISFDLRQLVRETMQTIAGRLEGKYQPEDQSRVELYVQIAAEIPRLVSGDPTKLRQILTNLLGNAVKFTLKGSIGLRVNVESANQAGLTLRFEVIDSGIGIPAEKLDTVFDPYKQADASTARTFRGTGLGLSIVKQFAEALGGSVQVASAPGEGSTFSVTLPLGLVERADTLADTTMPKRIVLVGPATASLTNLHDSFVELTAAEVELLDALAIEELTQVVALEDADVLVLHESRYNDAAVQTLLQRRRSLGKLCSVVLARPSSVELREQVYQSSLAEVLIMPALPEDIISLYRGESAELKAMQTADLTVATHGKLHILVVDDLLTNRIVLEDMLTDAGHQVSFANDGTEMLEKLSSMIQGEPGATSYDIVLTDISMAIMNGDEATRAVRELERATQGKWHVPIVAVTAHAFEEEQADIRQCGVDGILVKPIHPEKVAEEFFRILGAKQ